MMAGMKRQRTLVGQTRTLNRALVVAAHRVVIRPMARFLSRPVVLRLVNHPAMVRLDAFLDRLPTLPPWVRFPSWAFFEALGVAYFAVVIGVLIALAVDRLI